jgi:hypothetical protein
MSWPASSLSTVVNESTNRISMGTSVFAEPVPHRPLAGSRSRLARAGKSSLAQAARDHSDGVPPLHMDFPMRSMVP